MKIIKPLRLMVMPRPYRWRNGKYLSVALAALLKDENGVISILPEQALVHDILPELDADEVLDFVMPKPNPEYLVSGCAYTNHQEEKKHCMVSVRVGDKRKDALVFGDRFWIDGKISQAQVFESMPMTWSNSFGGMEYPANPMGTGYGDIHLNPAQTIRLPNVESPTNRINHKGQHVDPWNLGQIRIDWPQRLSKMGTYDEEWLKKVGTGFFDDMRPDVFNSASDDQIWKNKESLAMDESFEIWNMHPDMHSWSGTLPPIQARCFISRRGHPDSALSEISMRPTTVWFLPHRCSYVLIFHGQIAIQEDDGYDVTAIMAGLEYKNDSKSLEYYKNIYKVRANSETGALHALRDEELIPDDLIVPWVEKIDLEKHALLNKLNNRMSRESMAYPHGEFVGPIKPLSISDLPRLLEQGNRMRDEAAKEYKQEQQKLSSEMREKAKESSSGEDHQILSSIADSLEVDPMADDLRISKSGPPDFSTMLQSVSSLEGRRRSRSMLSQTGQNKQDMREFYEENKQALRKMYLYSVQYQNGVARVGPHKAVQLRERIQAKYNLNKNLRKMDLTGADLSGMDLSGADFSDAWLENADFSGANLKGAVFNNSVLARADFLNVNLDDSRFIGANISEATFFNASFIEAEFDDILVGKSASFKSCHFYRSTLTNFSPEGLTFSECKFLDSKFSGLSFDAGGFNDCGIEGSNLDKVSFYESSIEAVSITGTSIGNSIFSGSTLKDVKILDAVIARTVFTEDVVFQGCAMESTQIKQSLFREIDFSDTSFRGSVFDQCDFSLANMQNCDMREIQAPQSMFVRTNFEFATLAGSNLMHGNFQKSRFIGADLSGCNFFRSDMSEITVDASTRISGAYIHRTRLAPYREDIQPFQDELP